MSPTRVSADLDLPYQYVTCPNCGRLNAVLSGNSHFQCLKCGSDIRLDDDLTVVERPRSRQRRRWITASALGAVGLSLFLYALVQEFLLDLPRLRQLGIPAWEWWVPTRPGIGLHPGQTTALVPGYLGLVLLAVAAATAFRAHRRA